MISEGCFPLPTSTNRQHRRFVMLLDLRPTRISSPFLYLLLLCGGAPSGGRLPLSDGGTGGGHDMSVRLSTGTCTPCVQSVDCGANSDCAQYAGDSFCTHRCRSEERR